MVELQILSKILATGNYSILEDNYITSEYFDGTEFENEFQFVREHYEKYGNVPDKATFLRQFPEIELVEVNESDKYLVDTIREEYLFRKYAPILQQAAKLAKKDANAGVEYMLSAMKDLQPNYSLAGVDLIADAAQRLEHYKERVEHQGDWYFSSGFPELDNVIHGIQRSEEFVVLYARTNQGKSWVLEKIITNIWKQGFNVGYISPEMGADSIGYRFDTLYKGFSNKDLMWGNKDLNLEEYEKYIEELKKQKSKFIVATPIDFGNRITVSKLRNFVKQYKLEALAIDGITYMTDERGRRNDNKTTSLTNISEDLMTLSVELGIPILVVVQANRGGVVDGDSDKNPGLETIRDSDGISHNATKVISLRQKDDSLMMCVEKQRNGRVNVRVKYLWNINIGEFIPVSNDEDATKEEKAERRERKKAKGKDVF